MSPGARVPRVLVIVCDFRVSGLLSPDQGSHSSTLPVARKVHSEFLGTPYTM